MDPFRQIAAFAHRKINERVSALAHAPDQSALDNQVVEIAQPARRRGSRCRDPVVIHVIVGQLVRNVGPGGQHFLRDRVVNGVPIGIGHVVSVAVVLLAAAIFRRFVGAHAQRNPAEARIGGAGIVCALNDGAVFNCLVFGSEHHAAISRSIRAKDHIAHVRLGVIRVRRIEGGRLVGVFATNGASSAGRQLALNDVLARIQVAVLFFVKPDPQRERLVLHHLIHSGDVDAVRVNARHFWLSVGVFHHRGQKVNGVGFGGFPFERQRPRDFGLWSCSLAARFAAHGGIRRRENHAVRVVFKCAGVYLRHERGAALEYALILSRVFEFLAFYANGTCGCGCGCGCGCAADNRARLQFICHFHQQRQAELGCRDFGGRGDKMQRAHVLAGDVIHVKRGKEVDEPAVLVVQDVLAIQQRVEQLVIAALRTRELHAHVGVNEVNAARRRHE